MQNQQNIALEDRKSLKCKRCGRKLKNPESIELGFGVICYQKYQNRKKLIPLFKIPKQKEADEMNERIAVELKSKTEKITKLETKVKDIRKDNKVKDYIIAELVSMLPKEVAGDGKALVKRITKAAKERLTRC